MFRAGSVLGVFLVAAFSGCFGGGGATQKTVTTSSEALASESKNVPAPTTTPQVTVEAPLEGQVEFRLDNFTSDPNTSKPLVARWTLSFTGFTPDLNHTDLHFGTTSHEVVGCQTEPDASYCTDPANADPGYDATATTRTDGEGKYSAEQLFAQTGRIYFRVHALVDNVSHWTNESSVMVAVALTGVVRTIDIVGAASVATYTPFNVMANVGDGVRWHNADAAMATHTASTDAGAPAAFSESVYAGSDSNIVYLTVEGMYGYHCGIHPQTMMGASITVG